MGAPVHPPFGAADQLDDAAAPGRVGHVLLGDPRDPLGVNVPRIDVGAERQRGEDADFAAGVLALDVVGGVALGIAELLGERERAVKGDALAEHLGQDEVCGAVEDAGDLLDAVGRQAHVQRRMIGMPPPTLASKR